MAKRADDWRPEAARTLVALLKDIADNAHEWKPMEKIGAARVLAEALTAANALEPPGDDGE